MRFFQSISFKIPVLVIIPVLLLGIAVTVIGSYQIYSVTESAIKSELTYAAQTLKNIYSADGRELVLSDGVLYSGGTACSEEDFIDKVNIIACSNQLDFTVFWGNVRILTTVTNSGGDYAIGTVAAEVVNDNVIVGGRDYFDSDVEVNGSRYMGYYVPISYENGTVGMIFAGMPLSMARTNMLNSMTYFIGISVIVMIAAAAVCIFIASGMTKSLWSLANYTGIVASGDFSPVLPESVLSKQDEIGELARSTRSLCVALCELIEHDALTGLLNRRSGMELLEKCSSSGESFCLAMGDIDYFKRINDSYGHGCGDSVLKTVSMIMKEHCDKNNAAAVRWGGEEFIIIYRNRSSGEAVPLCRQLAGSINTAAVPVSEGGTVSITMTFGIAYGTPGCDVDELVNRADKLLYEGKNAGRNRIIPQAL